MATPVLTSEKIGGYWSAESVHPGAPMNFHSTRIVLQQFVLWCVLAAVVALLTLLFTVLGTITCAVLMGMMMAAIKHRPWQVIPISLVFPAVVIAMVHFAKVELPGPQRIVLPVLCFAVFWLIYLATFALVRFEARHQRARSGVTAASVPNVLSEPVADAMTRLVDRTEGPAPAAELRLEELQGKWSCETGSNGHLERKVIEVVGRHLSLNLIAADGRVRRVAEGELTLERSGLSARPPTPFGELAAKTPQR